MLELKVTNYFGKSSPKVGKAVLLEILRLLNTLKLINNTFFKKSAKSGHTAGIKTIKLFLP